MLASMWPLSVIAPWARVLARVPARLVVAEHSTWSRSELLKRRTVGWQVRTSMQRFFPWADGVVAVSNGAADDLAQFAGLKREMISVIYNPVTSDESTASIGCAESAAVTGVQGAIGGFWQSGRSRR